MKRRNLILLLGGASSGALTVGTGAFSSAQVERGVNVNVVEDDEAFVGYDSGDAKEATDGETLELVTVENRFANDVKLSVSEFVVTPESGDYPDIDGLTPESSEETGSDDPETIHVGAGESETIDGTVRCDGNSGRATVEVTIRVEGGGVSAELFGDTETRRFDVVCGGETAFTAESGVGVKGVEFNGEGNAEILSPYGGEVDVRVYYVDGDGVAETDFKPVEVDEKLKEHPSITNETFAGVEIDGISGVFVHPQFNKNECDVTPENDDEDENGVSGGTVTEIEDPDDAFDGCLDGD